MTQFLSQPKLLQKNLGLPYITLQLEAETIAVMPLKYIQEVLVVPSFRITPMPQMPQCILGLLNKRSRIFWVADLAQMLELEPLNHNTQQYNIAIAKVEDRAIALAVQSIQGVQRLPIELLQSPVGYVSPGLVPYLQSCVLQAEQVLLVLETEAIISSPLLPRD